MKGHAGTLKNERNWREMKGNEERRKDMKVRRGMIGNEGNSAANVGA